MRAFAPGGERLRLLTDYLRQIPGLITQIQERLARSSSRAALLGAQSLFQRLLTFYQEQAPALGLALLTLDDIPNAVPSRTLITLPLATDAACYRAALDDASGTLAQFAGWLAARAASADAARNDLAAHGAMGEETLTTMLRICLREEASLDTLLALGAADLEHNRMCAAEISGRMALGARSLRDAFRALDSSSEGVGRRWTATRITEIGQDALNVATAIVDELRDFTRECDLLPANAIEGDCRVAFQPSYLASPFALLESSGAFERVELPAWLYLPRPPVGALAHGAARKPSGRRMTAALRNAWLARMTPWTLRNTVAHEAIPGHYAFQRALHSIPSWAARAFRNYATFEGWAHYAEELVVEQGFGADDPRNALAMRRAAIHRDCRYLISLRLHTGDLSLDDATSFIVDQTGLARPLAEAEARRCLADPACVGYTLGKLHLLRLREDYARQRGADFTLRGFHETVLALGQLPPSLIRPALLTNR